MAKNDKLSGGALLALFTYAFITAMGFPQKSAYFPLIISVLGMVLSIILIIRGYVQGKRGTATTGEKLSLKARKMILFMSIAIILYAVAISELGFCVSTFLFLVVASWVLYPGKISRENSKPAILIIAVSLVVTILVFVVFKMLLYVPLPSGIFI